MAAQVWAKPVTFRWSKGTCFCIITPTTLNVCITKHWERSAHQYYHLKATPEREPFSEYAFLNSLLYKMEVYDIWATHIFQTEAIRKLTSKKLYHCSCKLNALLCIYYLESYGEWHHLLHSKICHLLSVLKQVLTTSRHTVQTLESLQHNEAALHIHPVTKWCRIIIKLQLHFYKLGICRKEWKRFLKIFERLFIIFIMVKTKRISLQVAKASCFPTMIVITYLSFVSRSFQLQLDAL